MYCSPNFPAIGLRATCRAGEKSATPRETHCTAALTPSFLRVAENRAVGRIVNRVLEFLPLGPVVDRLHVLEAPAQPVGGLLQHRARRCFFSAPEKCNTKSLVYCTQ